MSNYNKAIVMGNLTRDPEIRYTPSNKAVCNFTIASNHKYKDKVDTLYLDVVAWGKAAETIGDYMKKGRPILVEGRLIQDNWEDKEGKKRTKIKLNMESFQFIGRRDDSEDGTSNKPSDDEPPF